MPPSPGVGSLIENGSEKDANRGCPPRKASVKGRRIGRGSGGDGSGFGRTTLSGSGARWLRLRLWPLRALDRREHGRGRALGPCLSLLLLRRSERVPGSAVR